MRIAVPLLVVTGIGMAPMFGQDATKPAPVLSIDRESIKEGRTAAHEKVEAEYAATFRRANFPGHYVALAALSGPNEVWFIQPMPSFAANEDYEKASGKEPLKSALALMDARDGELRTASRTIWAVYRPDLSYKPESFNPAKSRFVDLGTFRVRLGKGEDFANGAKAYFGGYAKGNVDLCILGYEVTAGAPSGTYLFFTMMDSMKVLDGDSERMKAVSEGMGQDNFSQLMKGLGDIATSIEDTLFEVKPGMSYPPQSFVDADPGFWKPKPVARPAAAPA
ncbi:MAG: hypothetical protein ACLQVN_22945 [Bryobacteraceae bacterium]